MRIMMGLLAACLLLSGSVRAADRAEVIDHPDLLQKADFDGSKVTVKGVGLGDAVDSIAKDKIDSTKGTRINLKGGVTVLSSDGKVEELAISPAVVRTFNLGITTAADIDAKFGKPDEVLNRTGGKVPVLEYHYVKRSLAIVFIKSGETVSVGILLKAITPTAAK